MTTSCILAATGVLCLAGAAHGAPRAPEAPVYAEDASAAILIENDRSGRYFAGTPLEILPIRAGCARQSRRAMRCGFVVGGMYWARGRVWTLPAGRMAWRFAVRTTTAETEPPFRCVTDRRSIWTGRAARPGSGGHLRELVRRRAWVNRAIAPRPGPKHPCASG